jgi:hypothetical protein
MIPEHGAAQWVCLAWRLPAGSSTPRVTTWRSLRRLGAGRLTPGAAVLPFRDDLIEQLDWLAQDIENLGGDAWVLPVTGLSEADERRVRARMVADRDEEYLALQQDAVAFVDRRSVSPVSDDDYPSRLQVDKELLALQRRFRKIRARDYADAAGRLAAAQAIDRALVFRQGVSPKLLAVTDAGPRPSRARHTA